MNQPKEDIKNVMVIPQCPHCGQELANLGLFHWQIPSGIIVAIYCPLCKVSLHFDAIMVTNQQPQKSVLAV